MFVDVAQCLSLGQNMVQYMLPSWRILTNNLGNKQRHLEARLPQIAALLALLMMQTGVATSFPGGQAINALYGLEVSHTSSNGARPPLIDDGLSTVPWALLPPRRSFRVGVECNETQSVTRLVQPGEFML